MTNRWKVLAIVLLVVVALEAIWVYAHWDLITTSWKNRKVIGDVAGAAGGVQSAISLFGDVKGALK